MNNSFSDIKQAFEAAGYEPRSYSGRGMYGKECLGVSGDSALEIVLETIETVASQAGDTETIAEFVADLLDVRTDSMGRGEIVYWPSIKWEDEVQL